MANNSNVKEESKVKICSGHTRPICHINYSKIIDGTYWFITSCHDAKPMLRNGETGDWVGTFEGHRGAVYCSAFNEGATRCVTGSGDYSAIIWDALTGQNLHAFQHDHYVKSCDWLNDKVVTGNFDSHVRVFDAEKYDAEPEVFQAMDKATIKSVYFANSTDSVISAGDDTIKLWDMRKQKDKCVKSLEINGLNVLEYTHQHNLCAAHQKSVSFINPTTLSLVGVVETPEDVECGSLSPDGRFLAVGSKIKAKEFTLDGTELENHRGHHGPVFHIRYSPDGATFATGSEDGMVRVWPSHDTIVKCQEP